MRRDRPCHGCDSRGRIAAFGEDLHRHLGAGLGVVRQRGWIANGGQVMQMGREFDHLRIRSQAFRKLSAAFRHDTNMLTEERGPEDVRFRLTGPLNELANFSD